MNKSTATGEADDRALQRIRELIQQRREIERRLSAEVRKSHQLGYSWEAIALALGVSRQAAHKKYGKIT